MSDIEKMQPARRTRRVISAVDKERIVDAFHDPHMDYVEVAAALNIPRGTAWSIIRRCQRDGEVIVRRRGGRRPCLVSADMRAALVDIIVEHPAFTLNQVNAELRHRLPTTPHLSIATLHRALKLQLITLKKLEHVPEERNRDDVVDARRQHAEWFVTNVDEVVYIDESGFNLWTARTRGRAPRGDRAVRIVGGRSGPNFTLLLAVSSQRGLIHHTMREGGVDMVRFNTFLSEASTAAGDGRITFLFDNAPCHRRAGEAVVHAHHVIRYLPAYSPFLNVAENCFAAWKAAVRRTLEDVRDQMLRQRHAERLAVLTQVAEQNMDSVTPQLCIHSHNAIRRLIPRLLRGEDLLQQHP